MGKQKALAAVAAVIALAGCAPWHQQGPKLVGTGATGPVAAGQGVAVALSADGDTAIVGGPFDNTDTGAAWVFTRAGGAWSQQGPKLVGAGAAGPYPPRQGFGVSLSADGNTAIVGAPADDAQGAAWVYTRAAGVWSQYGAKLVGTGASGNAEQGASAALSADGNTALLGGPDDKNGFVALGAAWVFIRAGGVWSQQGPKLVGTGAVNPPTGLIHQGASVALSADGNTAILGGPFDNNAAGAAWVFTRAGGVWSQQGPTLVGTGAAGAASQGWSVSLSADGNTAILGGPSDGSVGAAWVFIRAGGVWSQQGPKLVGTDAILGSGAGSSVSLSGDGNTAILGGSTDHLDAGAAWVFTRAGGAWSQQGAKLFGTGSAGAAEQGTAVSLSADGRTALVAGPNDNGAAGAVWVFTDPAP